MAKVGDPGFRVRRFEEKDFDEIIANSGGRRAHPDAARRRNRGADYILGDAVIELKLLDNEGFSKPERQLKLAALFRQSRPGRPVIVLDPAQLSAGQRREYERIVSGPIKGAVASARKQLARSRAENSAITTTVLLIVNNGYTALDHEELLHLVTQRVRNDTTEIDGVLVAGCYFYSDGFDSFFIWPMHYEPLQLNRSFGQLAALRDAWQDFSERSMTELMKGHVPAGDLARSPVVDLSFDLDGITFVRPAPPMGAPSSFYRNGRPRENSSGIAACPPVAITFPEMSRSQWRAFKELLPHEFGMGSDFDEWQRHLAEAHKCSTSLKPLVPVSVNCVEFQRWCSDKAREMTLRAVREYANDQFNQLVHRRIDDARELSDSAIMPSRYVLVQTEEIGQDRANDISHISIVNLAIAPPHDAREVVRNERIFHEHAVALASAYAVAEGIECVLWQKDGRYAGR